MILPKLFYEPALDINVVTSSFCHSLLLHSSNTPCQYLTDNCAAKNPTAHSNATIQTSKSSNLKHEVQP